MNANPPGPEGIDVTPGLLRQWNEGDVEALEKLLQLHGGWIRDRVRHRLGPALRGKLESMDIVQDTFLEFLKSGPRFVVEDAGQFRTLMAKVLENRIRDRRDWFTAQCRAMAREERRRGQGDSSGSSNIADLSASGRSSKRPDQQAAANEWQAMVRLAVMLLDPDDRDLIVMRQWQELPFEEIGQKLGIAPDAARMRFNRALPRLAAKVDELRQGKVE